MINLNKFFNKMPITELSTGSELVLVAELCKCASHWLHDKISIKGIKIREELLTSQYFFYLRSTDVMLDDYYRNLQMQSYNARKFLDKTLEDVMFEEKTEAAWVYSKRYMPDVNLSLTGGDLRNYAYVAMLAMVLTYRYMYNTKTILHINNSGSVPMEYEYTDIYILRDYGNKFAKDLVKIDMADNDRQIEWEAFRLYNLQLGYMSREYSVDEKIDLINKEFKVGDVVLLYTRVKGAQWRTIHKLKSCFPAVIRGITDKEIIFEYYTCIETRLTRKKKLDSARSNIFTQVDYDRFQSRIERYYLMDVGVDIYTYKEVVFFLKVVSTDGSMQYFSDGEKDVLLFLSTPDTIYAVFEDRGIEYNKDRFLDEYFANRKPVYDLFLEGNVTILDEA